VNLRKETVVAKRQYAQIHPKTLLPKALTYNIQRLISLKQSINKKKVAVNQNRTIFDEEAIKFDVIIIL
jgi:hypothetical protein